MTHSSAAEHALNRRVSTRVNNSHMNERAPLHNEHHGRLEYTSIRGEFCWVFVPRPVSP